MGNWTEAYERLKENLARGDSREQVEEKAGKELDRLLEDEK